MATQTPMNSQTERSDNPDPPWNPPKPAEPAAVKSAAEPAESAALVMDQQSVGEERIGRIGLQIVDDDFLMDHGDALDLFGAETASVEGEDGIADLERLDGLERAAADVEGVLGRDVNRDVPRPDDPVLVHFASHHASDPGAYRLAGDRKRQQTVVGAHARDGNLRAILLADERLGQKAPLVVDHDAVGQVRPAWRDQQVVGRSPGGNRFHRRDNAPGNGAALADQHPVAGPQGGRGAKDPRGRRHRVFPREPQDMSPDGDLVIRIGVNRGYRPDLGGQEAPIREADYGVARFQSLHGDRAGRRDDGGALRQAAASSAAKGR